ncbi:hypothetical protein ACHAXR_010025 [Thalassiosira sp. AJA248-18]
MISGIIYSLTRNYYRQNTNKSDFHNIAVKLATIKSLTLAADARIITNNNNNFRPPPTPTPTTVHPSAPETIYSTSNTIQMTSLAVKFVPSTILSCRRWSQTSSN